MNHSKLRHQFIGGAILVIVCLIGYSVPTATAQSPVPTPLGGEGGRGQCPMGQEPGGPYYHQVHLAHSTDGLTWQSDNIPIRRHTSVPNLVLWKGTVWMYAIDGLQHGLIVLRQDGSVWWETRTQIDGFDSTCAVDPDVVILPDGRLRLYFLDFKTLAPLPDNSPGVPTINSAVTSDGVHFALDAGNRFKIKPPGPGTDPDVVQAADGSWWMYVLYRAGAVIAHSTDGLVFKEVGETDTGAMSDTVRLDDGTLRMYYAPPGAIRSQVSTDGLHWKIEAGERIKGKGVGQPTVTRLGDGSWLMAYLIDTTP